MFAQSTGITIYRKKKRLADALLPETAEQNRFSVDNPLIENTKGLDAFFSAKIKTGYQGAKATILAFKEERLVPLFSDPRQAQLKELELPAQNQQRPAGGLRLTNTKDIKAAGAALGLATAGLIYAPLGILSIPIIIYGSYPIVKNSYNLLRKKREINMDTLVTVTMVAGLVFGTGFFFNGSLVPIWLLSMNVFLFTYSRRLLAQIRGDSRGKIIDIFSQQPSSAWLVSNGVEFEISVEKLQVGDVVAVHAGSVIPIDGHIIEGMASIDQRVLTGESQPAEKGPGEMVFALTVVMAGKIYVAVEKAGEETTAAQIGQILNNTLNFKTGMQLWAEALADKSVLPTLAATGLSIPILGPQSAWAILLAHPKYKTTVATYISILTYFNQASHHGLLIKDGQIFELLNEVDTVVFDKTGTLTEEQPHIGQVYTAGGYTEEQILTYAAAAEHRQSHPIAMAILKAAVSRELDIPPIHDAAYKVGYGLTVMLDDKMIRVGSIRFIEQQKMIIPATIREAQAHCHHQGYSLVLVAVDDEVAGAISLEPTVRPEAQTIIHGLRERGIKAMYIISGDHETPTKKLADELGIDQYFAETLPENKADLIEQLQNQGKTVCYVGDGINDAIALKKAAVSVSLRGASTVATDTAQAILMDGSLNKLCNLFDIAQSFDKNMRQTFMMVLAPHLICLGGVLFLHFGVVHAIVLSQFGLAVGVGNALRPKFKRSSSILSENQS